MKSNKLASRYVSDAFLFCIFLVHYSFLCLIIWKNVWFRCRFANQVCFFKRIYTTMFSSSFSFFLSLFYSPFILFHLQDFAKNDEIIPEIWGKINVFIWARCWNKLQYFVPNSEQLIWLKKKFFLVTKKGWIFFTFFFGGSYLSIKMESVAPLTDYQNHK